jgi:hypothetical protein
VGTPSNDEVPAAPTARQIVADLAVKHGVEQLRETGPMQVLDPEQFVQARGFLGFKSGDDTPDKEIARRGARILMARAGALLREKVWGLTDDSNDPDAADFSDVARSLDIRARDIHGGKA